MRDYTNGCINNVGFRISALHVVCLVPTCVTDFKIDGNQGSFSLLLRVDT